MASRESCHIFSQQDWVLRDEHAYQYGFDPHDHAPCLESSGRNLGLAHLRREVHPQQQVLEARVVAEGFQEGH